MVVTSEQIKYEFEDLYTVKLGEYKFRLRPEAKKAFAKRIDEDSEFEKALMRNKSNDDFFASLEYVVRYHSNSIIQIFGIPESGKSTIAKITIFNLSMKLENEGYSPEIKQTYDYAATIHEIAEFGKDHINDDEYVGSERRLIIFQDEQSSLQGPESRAYEIQLNTLLERFRAAQIFVILVSPNLRKFSVCNTFIEAVAKDPDKLTNLSIWHVRPNGSKLFPSGFLLFEYTEDIDQFFVNYEKAKMDDIIQLMKKRGLVTVRIPDDVLQEGIQRVLEEAGKRKLRTKEQVKAVANVLGLGTSNTTKTIAELAALQFEAEKEEERERRQLLEIQEKKEAAIAEKKRINELVIAVARELFEKFDFYDEGKKGFSRLTKGYIIENYPNDWQELLKNHNHMWSLAEYWQSERVSIKQINDEKNEVSLDTTDRELLRKSLEKSIKFRYPHDTLLQKRAAMLLIPDEDFNDKTWSYPQQARRLTLITNKALRPNTLAAYWRKKKNEKVLKAIRKNTKIWGDAGELYLASKIRQIVKKGKTDGSINQKVAIDLICAAEVRSKSDSNKSNRKTTKLYDLEILITKSKNKKSGTTSAAAVNIKFTYLDNQSFKMDPEKNHDNPYLFVIDKNNLKEILIPSEKGKTHITVNQEGSIASLTVEQFIQVLLVKFK